MSGRTPHVGSKSTWSSTASCSHVADGGVGERVVGRAHEHEVLVAERLVRKRAQVRGGRHEGDIERVGAQRVDEVVRAGLPELDLHLRVAAVEAVDERGRVHHAQALLGADAQGAGNLVRRVDDGVAGGAFLVEHRAGVREQREGGVGGFDAAGGAGEQRRAELLLEPANASGKARTARRR